MSTRVATVDDLDAIMLLERATFISDAWSDTVMRDELASPHGCYLVIEEAGRLVGYGGVRAVKGATDADIQTIAIADSARGAGRGRALLTALLGEAVQRGARRVFLEVRADNPVAQALYASEGFVEIARRPHYYQPDDVDAIVMQVELAGWAGRAAGADGQRVGRNSRGRGTSGAHTAESPDFLTAPGDAPRATEAGART